MQKNTVILLGSSRSKGNTFSAVELVRQQIPFSEVLDLANFHVSDFDYDYKNSADSFANLLKEILEYKTIILATPIYWYTMSATMKRFVDRLTEVLDIDHPLFGKITQKNLAVITSYASYPEGKDGFDTIFKNTAKFLGMNYVGCYFHYAGDDIKGLEENPQQLISFIDHFAPRINL